MHNGQNQQWGGDKSFLIVKGRENLSSFHRVLIIEISFSITDGKIPALKLHMSALDCLLYTTEQLFYFFQESTRKKLSILSDLLQLLAEKSCNCNYRLNRNKPSAKICSMPYPERLTLIEFVIIKHSKSKKSYKGRQSSNGPHTFHV